MNKNQASQKNGWHIEGGILLIQSFSSNAWHNLSKYVFCIVGE